MSEELGVRYVLEGTVQRAGDRVRVHAQLIDATKGHHLWAERIDSAESDVFALQDEVTQKIVAALAVEVTAAEAERVQAQGHGQIHGLRLRVARAGCQPFRTPVSAFVPIPGYLVVGQGLNLQPSGFEYQRLGAALKEIEVDGSETASSIAAVRLLMLTGCRLSEIQKLRWEHVDLGASELRLPDTKTGAKVVYLRDPVRTAAQ